MEDKFQFGDNSISGPAARALEITPADGSDLAYATRGLYVGGTGDLKVTLTGGDTVTFVNVASGVIHPLRVARVFSTDTTATNIVGVY